MKWIINPFYAQWMMSSFSSSILILNGKKWKFMSLLLVARVLNFWMPPGCKTNNWLLKQFRCRTIIMYALTLKVQWTWKRFLVRSLLCLTKSRKNGKFWRILSRDVLFNQFSPEDDVNVVIISLVGQVGNLTFHLSSNGENIFQRLY